MIVQIVKVISVQEKVLVVKKINQDEIIDLYTDEEKKNNESSSFCGKLHIIVSLHV